MKLNLKKKIIILLTTSFFFTLCCNANAKEESDWGKDLFRTQTNNSVPFTLDYPDSKGKPVIKWVINDKEFFFMCDTGQSYCSFSKNGIEKIYGSLDEFYNDTISSYIQFRDSKEFNLGHKNRSQLIKLINRDISTGQISITKEISINKANKQIDCEFICFPEKSYNDKKIDGILGQSFFTHFNNITFDYKKKQMIFNDEKICENEIQMELNALGLYHVQFILNEQEEYGLIDTGCNYFIVRENLDKEQVLPSDEDFLEIIHSTKVEKKFPKTMTFHKIKIGEILFSNVKATNSSNIFVKTNPLARNILSIINCLGYPFFKDHVIQLDFENSVFRIK